MITVVDLTEVGMTDLLRENDSVHKKKTLYNPNCLLVNAYKYNTSKFG